MQDKTCIVWYMYVNVDWNSFTNPGNCPTNSTQVKLTCNDQVIIRSGVAVGKRKLLLLWEMPWIINPFVLGFLPAYIMT